MYASASFSRRDRSGGFDAPACAAPASLVRSPPPEKSMPPWRVSAHAVVLGRKRLWCIGDQDCRGQQQPNHA